MAFTLRINFSGLCMFVPQPASGEMLVLLPQPRGHTHGADRHVAVLGFDTAHLRGSATTRDGITALKRLAGLNLTLLGAGAENLIVCSEIVNLRSVTGKPASTAANARTMVARVVLRAGKMSGIAPGACWEWDAGKFRHLANEAEWKIDSSDASLVVPVSDFAGNALPPLQFFPITPASGTPFIDLIVHHVPVGDLPPEPDPIQHEPDFGAQPGHFLAYYSLFAGAVPVRLPRYWGSGE
ncbi:MAG TPA: hypothetical protein VFQ76_22070, partial [Longimicrobiaceae bacterium]|nr:hypothetical protein [Longimicrobiaceae bacterium]